MSGLKIQWVGASGANPNPKAATFDLGRDYLGNFGKIIIPKGNEKLKACVPIAASFLNMLTRNGMPTDIIRVDLFNNIAASAGTTTNFSIVRKIGEWPADKIDWAQKQIQEYLQKSALVNFDLIKPIPVQKPFDAGNDPIKKLVRNTFDGSVNRILATDGGAMEILDVNADWQGGITIKVALVGSCHGCPSALTSTLKEAENDVTKVLESLKEKYPGEPIVQKLHLRAIETVDVPHLVMLRPELTPA